MNDMETQSNNPEEVVVVTGGAGFLGQHIVKHLIEQREFPVREIRVFNRSQPLEWFPGLAVKEDTNVTVTQHLGDLCKPEDLQVAFKGATVVIHNAAIIDITSLPDVDKTHAINVIGTKNVIEACIHNNVEILVYASSSAAVEKIGHYGRSKSQAEQLVLQANKQLLNSGNGQISTCALRLPGIYGEGAKVLVNALQNGTIRNTVIDFGDKNAICQSAYAGNLAWAFVCAVRQLRAAATDSGPSS